MPTSMRRFRVASCFAEVTQQIHSFRASGVISDQRFLAVALDSMALRKSAGSLCTVPFASLGAVMRRGVSVSYVFFVHIPRALVTVTVKQLRMIRPSSRRALRELESQLMLDSQIYARHTADKSNRINSTPT
jgi:hypothetical protein